MHRRSLMVMTVGTLWLGLLAGQGCPGFYEEDVAAEGGSTSGGSAGSSGGTGGGGGSAGPTSVVNVEIIDAVFTPKTVTISTGQAVRWTNRDFITHAIRSGNPEDEDRGQLFRSGILGIRASFQHTFTEPGTYYYHCEYSYRLPGMRDAKVIVVGG